MRALQEWEQGRRVPDRAARVLLTVIDREPEAVVRALGEGGGGADRSFRCAVSHGAGGTGIAGMRDSVRQADSRFRKSRRLDPTCPDWNWMDSGDLLLTGNIIDVLSQSYATYEDRGGSRQKW